MQRNRERRSRQVQITQRQTGRNLQVKEGRSSTIQVLCLFTQNSLSLSIHHDISLNMDTVTIAPNKVAKNLGVVIDDRLSFSDHIASVARSCRYALYNIRKLRPYLTQYATQLLVQAMVISCLDYCNALLVGLPACAIKPLQMVQNAAARLVFNQPKRSHVTPLFINMHWLPVAARIQHKALTLAYKVTSGYLNVILNAYIPSRMLRSSNANRLAVPSPKTKRGHSKLFSVVVPQLWNNLPVPTRATSLSTFKKLVKTLLFRDCLTKPNSTNHLLT
ncbi:hypothetical protein ACEWY4_004387 [Coilia grayii]|uniref:Reverse transcriptase n=1 Tax=Coilia grayii TaxID=363190 RepID=A0ABD1KMF7_9TELE